MRGWVSAHGQPRGRRQHDPRWADTPFSPGPPQNQFGRNPAGGHARARKVVSSARPVAGTGSPGRHRGSAPGRCRASRPPRPADVATGGRRLAVRRDGQRPGARADDLPGLSRRVTPVPIGTCCPRSRAWSTSSRHPPTNRADTCDRVRRGAGAPAWPHDRRQHDRDREERDATTSPPCPPTEPPGRRRPPPRSAPRSPCACAPACRRRSARPRSTAEGSATGEWSPARTFGLGGAPGRRRVVEDAADRGLHVRDTPRPTSCRANTPCPGRSSRPRPDPAAVGRGRAERRRPQGAQGRQEETPTRTEEAVVPGPVAWVGRVVRPTSVSRCSRSPLLLSPPSSGQAAAPRAGDVAASVSARFVGGPGAELVDHARDLGQPVPLGPT